MIFKWSYSCLVSTPCSTISFKFFPIKRIILKLFSIRQHFCEHIYEWRKIYDSKEPHNAKFPAPMDKNLKQLQKIIILRCLRPDKVKGRCVLFGTQIICHLWSTRLKVTVIWFFNSQIDYPAYSSLSSLDLDLWAYCFPQFGNIFGYYFFKYYFTPPRISTAYTLDCLIWCHVM